MYINAYDNIQINYTHQERRIQKANGFTNAKKQRPIQRQTLDKQHKKQTSEQHLTTNTKYL